MTTSDVSTGVRSTALGRSLGVMDLTFLVVGTVIGSGIFLVPSVVLRQAGLSMPLALLVWTLGGVLSLLGALTYAELGAMYPDAGGLYTYIRGAFGALPAFLYGWTSFFVIASGSVATLAVAFATYSSQIVPLGPGGRKVIAVLVILVTTAVNVRSTKRSSLVQGWTTSLKVLALVALSLAMIALGHHGSASNSPTSFGSATIRMGIGSAMISVLWAYEGWQYVTFSAGEARNPQRSFPRAIATGTLVLIGIYLLANLGYVSALGAPALGSSDHVAVDAVRVVAGSSAGMIVGALILVSIFSAANGLMMTAPRLYFAMARDGVFFKSLAAVNPRFGTPALAILATALWSTILAVSGTFEQLLTYVVFTGWIFYALGGVSIFVYRRIRPDLDRPFRVPGYPITPVLFVTAAAALVLDTIWHQPQRAAFGIAAVIVGVPAFYAWSRAARRSPAASIHPGEVNS